MHCSLPGSSVHEISQARILEWATISFSRGSSQNRDQTHVDSLLLSHQGSLREALREYYSTIKKKKWRAAFSFFNDENQRQGVSCSPFKVLAFTGGTSGKESACQCRRHVFNPWVGKIPWKRKWQSTPVSLPGKSHEQRSLVGLQRVRHD